MTHDHAERPTTLAQFRYELEQLAEAGRQEADRKIRAARRRQRKPRGR